MRKRLLAALLAAAVVASLSAGCVQKGGTGSGTKTLTQKTKVGMSTDSGTIDDKSFNQGAWEGIKKYQADKNTIDIQYLKPKGQQETDYINSINDLNSCNSRIQV